MADVLGVDIGGVIIDRVKNGIDTSFYTNDYYLNIPAVLGAFEALKRLSKERFGFKTYLVSKCNPDVEAKTRHWLSYHNFYDKTRILRAHIYFCRKREEKAPICQQLGITHFIDDRLEVLSYLAAVKNKIAFAPREEEANQYNHILSQVAVVRTWEEILKLLLPDQSQSESKPRNIMRTTNMAQPRALQQGDVLATGDVVLAPPREGQGGLSFCNSAGRCTKVIG